MAVAVLLRRRKIYYGWWILAGSVAVMTVVSGLSSWTLGLFVRPLEDEFGWSRAQVSVGFSLSILVSGLAGPFIGHWVDRFGARSVVTVGCVLTACSYILLAATNSLWQWYLFSVIAAGFRQMMFFIPFQAVTSRWFDRKRGAALSILGTGFSLGGFIVLPLVALVIEATDWRVGFVFSGALTAVVVLPIAIVILRNRPEDVGATVDGMPPGDPRTEPTVRCWHDARAGYSYTDALGAGTRTHAVLLRVDRLDGSPDTLFRVVWPFSGDRRVTSFCLIWRWHRRAAGPGHVYRPLSTL